MVNKKLYQIKRAVEEHGEVHMTVAEIDAEVEVRKGVMDVDHENELLSVYDGQTRHYFHADDIVHWYKPMDVFHA